MNLPKVIYLTPGRIVAFQALGRLPEAVPPSNWPGRLPDCDERNHGIMPPGRRVQSLRLHPGLGLA